MFTIENFIQPCSITSMAKGSIKSANMLCDYVITESARCTRCNERRKRGRFFPFPFLRTKKIKRTVSRPEHS